MSILNKNLDTHFFLELKSPNKVKIFDYHLTKPLIAYVNVNNVLAIWDWERKTCLKCFSAAAIESKDLSKTVTVKSIKFLDKDILNALFPGEIFDSEAPFYAGTWLIVVAESKIYFYDYVSEKSETISLAQLDGKQPRCVEPVDMKHLAVGCTDGYVKNFDLGAWSTVKTLKGFHHKTVYNMMGYKHGDNSKNRLVVSGSDGTLACWNVEAEEILFKFGMLKNGKQLNTANSQEELTGIDYNRASNHIVTVTQSYVTVWSSLTGEEIIRYKGIKDSYKNHLVEAVYLPYGSLSKDLMIGHSKSSEILMFDVNKSIKGKEKEPFLDCTTLVDFKNFEGYDKSLRIYNLKVHYEKPHLIFATTSQGTFILSLLKTSPPLNIIASPYYSAYITPKEVKEMLTEDGTVKKLTSDHIQKCQTYELLDLENKSSNITVLSVNSDNINCHLIDRTKLHLLPEGAQATIKSVIGQVEAAAIDEEFELRSNLDGRYFSIRYQKSGLFNVYAITNKNLSLPRESDNLIQLESLHPAGKVERIHTGCAVSLEWHQDRDEFAALVPLDKSGKPIEVKEKVETVSKGGFFGGKHSKKAYFVDTNNVSKTILYLFHVYVEGSSVKVGVKQKTEKYVEPKKLFGGPFYGIVDKMTEPDFNELITPEIEPLKRDLRSAMGIKLTFFTSDESSGEIEKVGRPMLAAEHVYWNLAGNILIAAYRTSFFVFKYHPHELSFKLFASTNRKIHEGYFWENIFFYTTDTAIRMALFDLPEGLLDIVIAEDNQGNNLVSDLFLDEYFTKGHDFVYDTIYPHPQIKPPGNLKFIGVYDYKLILAGSREEFFKIDLDHPFIKICLNLQFNNGKECLEEVKKIDTKSWETVFDLFEAYNCHTEADGLLGLMTEREIELKSRCVLKRSFYRDNKECLTWLENSEDLSQRLKESLGLEFFKHYNSFPNFDMEGMPEAFRSDVMTVLCADKTTAQLVDRNPGLDLVLKKDREIEEMNLKGYFEKLLSLDK